MEFSALFLFLFEDWLGRPAWMWIAFFALVLSLVAFDLGIAHRKAHEMDIRESLSYSAFYVSIAIAFGWWVWHTLGRQSGEEFFTGYLIEETLSLDNIFVMSLIFSYFQIPRRFQHRVLFWGILGVIVLRAVMIGAGVAAIHRIEWILSVFAVFLVLTGIKMLFTGSDHPDIQKNPILLLLRRFMNVTPTIYGQHFFVRQVDPVSGKVKRYATPLFLALVLIEFSDIVFAVDSVPAIFAITPDPFIVYTSNIFAILGLRALYFALAAAVHRFRYLKHALSILLMFIGGKILAAECLGVEEIPATISLAVTATLICAGILISLLRTRKEA